MSTDHETFLLLVSKDLQEGLSIDESRELDGHLAACPSCRETARGMRRDAAEMGAMLGEAPVAPRVRAAVLESAAGRRRSGTRLVLVVAGLLVIGVLGLPILAGGPTPAPSVLPTGTASASSPTPGASPTGSPIPSPTPQVEPSVAPAGGSVDGDYAYTVAPGATRRDSVSARLDPDPTGEWSRMVPATGGGTFSGGPVTCLVIDGPDAWLAGPATTSSDGSVDRSAFLHVHDGGPGGAGDTAILWMNDPGQTLVTMEGWCTSRFIPAGPYPLDDGDVTVRAGE